MAPFDSIPTAPMLYTHPRASGASEPPKIMEAPSLMQTATYDSGLPVAEAMAAEQADGGCGDTIDAGGGGEEGEQRRARDVMAAPSQEGRRRSRDRP